VLCRLNLFCIVVGREIILKVEVGGNRFCVVCEISGVLVFLFDSWVSLVLVILFSYMWGLYVG